MAKKKFLFYTSWKKNIDIMDDVELRRFINNLINYTEDKPIELLSKVDTIVWNDAVELLNHNEVKRQKTIERNQKNGQSGGRPAKPKETQNNPVGFNETHNNPQEPEEGRRIQDEGRRIQDEGREMKDEGRGTQETEDSVFEDFIKKPTSKKLDVLCEIFGPGFDVYFSKSDIDSIVRKYHSKIKSDFNKEQFKFIINQIKNN
jgi:hypothetical protein